MKKKKVYNIDALVKPYLPLNNKRKIEDLVLFLQSQKIPFSKKLDTMICNNIATDDLRFYYDCISPMRPHNLSTLSSKKKKKKNFLGGILNTVTKFKKRNKNNIEKNGSKNNNSSRTIVINPNSSDYNSQIMKANLNSRYKDYDYGLSDW